MITLSPKFHKCPYTGQPADHIVFDDTTNVDHLRYFISSAAVKKFYSSLHYRQLAKIPIETRSKEIIDKLAKLDNPIYVVLNESSGADISQRVKFAQEIINLCMPNTAKAVAIAAIHHYRLNHTHKEFADVKDLLWDLFVDNTSQRLALKKRKFKTCASLEIEDLRKIYEFFFKLVEKLYKDLLVSCSSSTKRSKSPQPIVHKDPFFEENKAYEPYLKEAPFLSKVRSEKARVPVQSPYATTFGEKFYEKKSYEYETPKAVPDAGFNHFRELGKVQKTDFALNLDFTKNAKNVTNTTFFNLLESLPKFGSLRSISLDISGGEDFGVVGFGYLKAALLRLQLESFTLRAAGCQTMNDACIENIVKGLANSPKLTTFILQVPRCQALTENSLISLCELAKNNKSLRRLTLDFTENNNLTDSGVVVLRKLLDGVRLSHLELHFAECENVTKKGKESLKFFARNCPKIGFSKLT